MIDGGTSRLAVLWRRVLALVRLRAYDVSTPEGRANERHRRVALTALAGAAAKVISVATALISIPLTLHYLGPERYGLWMTISSLVAILAFADLGIGNGIVNSIAAAHGRDDRAAVRGFVSSGFFVLTLVALAMFVLFAVAYTYVPWPAVFNVDTPLAVQEVGPAVAVFVACFTLAMPVGIVGRVQIALQRGFLASLWQCLASILGLVGIIFAIRLEAGLPWLVLAFMGAPLIASALNSLVFFGNQAREIAPCRRAVSRVASTQLLRTGSLFLVLQVVAAVAYASDSLVIAQLLGAAAVAEFAVPERMFSLITMVLAITLAPLWPAYGEAIARGDAAWVKRTLKRSIVIAVALSGMCSFVLVLLSDWIIRAWVGDAVRPTLLLLVGLAVWKTIEAGATGLAVFLNGANIVRTQLIVSSITLVAALSLKLWLVPRIGIAGAVWATVIAFTVCALIPYSILTKSLVRNIIRQQNPSSQNHP